MPADRQAREDRAIAEFGELRESVEAQDRCEISRVANEPKRGNENQERAELDKNVKTKIVREAPPQHARDAAGHQENQQPAGGSRIAFS